MIYLPDVNFWIALASDQHIHAESATAWLQSIGNGQVAFCRITELGLLRLLTNVHVMGEEVRDHLGAWDVYDEIRTDSRILFLSERAGFSERWRMAKDQIAGGSNALTDAYLAVFARHADATVVTFDRGFKAVSGCDVIVVS